MRYLKYLSADWQGFAAACQRMSPTASCDAAVSGLTYERKTEIRSCPDRVESGFCFQPMAPGLRLVDYDSSDESDPDTMEISEETWQRLMGPEVSVCQQSGQDKRRPPGSIRQTQYLSSDSTDALSDPNSSLERRPPLSVVQSEHSGKVFCEASASAVFCLSQLRKVVTRLHTKKLFPYNPSSLLKLLAQLEKCSQESHPFTRQ